MRVPIKTIIGLGIYIYACTQYHSPDPIMVRNTMMEWYLDREESKEDSKRWQIELAVLKAGESEYRAYLDRSYKNEGLSIPKPEDSICLKDAQVEISVMEYYKNGVKIDEEVLGTGDKETVYYNSNNGLEHAKEIKSDRVVIKHNHIKRTITPSELDLESKNKQLSRFGNAGIAIEFKIVTKEGEYSY